MTLSEPITAPLKKSEAATSKKSYKLNASASLLETLCISCVRTDGGTQPRAGLNSEVIEDYVQAIAGGAEFPPVIVFYDGTNYWLADGFHRVEATKKAGFPAIAADVRQGNRRDAVLFSVGANAKHGLRRSNADKRRAVLTLLSDSEWAQWSNSEIAKQCGVVEWLVRKLKEELSSCNTKIDQEYAKKCGVNKDTLIEVQQRLESLPQERTAQRLGKTFSVNTANIGRNSKKATCTNEPTPATLFSEAKPVEVFFTVPLAQPKEHQPKAQILDISAEEVEDKDATVISQAALQLLGEEDVQPEIPPLFTASSSTESPFFAHTSNSGKIGQPFNRTLVTPADNSENGCPVFSKSNKLQNDVQPVSRSSLLGQQLQQNDVALRLTRTSNQLLSTSAQINGRSTTPQICCVPEDNPKWVCHLFQPSFLPAAWSGQVIPTDMDEIPFDLPPQPNPLRISEICLSFVANVEFFSDAEVLIALKAIHTRIPPAPLVLHTRTDTELKRIIKDAQRELNHRHYPDYSKVENGPHASQEP